MIQEPENAVKMSEVEQIDGQWYEKCPECGRRAPLAMGHQSYCTSCK